MILKIKHFVIFTTFIVLASCQEKSFQITAIKAQQLAITDSVATTDTILSFITPFKKRIDQVLDSTLAYAPKTITKEDGEFNTSAGNLMADIVLSEADPIFESRTGNNIDVVVLNNGGIRSIISKGNINARTAYEVMPFENTIVVVELNGRAVREMASFLIKSKRPHPIAGMQIVLDTNSSLQSISIQGKPFDETRSYFVATSNYLVTGGDNMKFFQDGLAITELDYLIRNAMIDYFKKVDTVAPIVDQRFIRLKENE